MKNASGAGKIYMEGCYLRFARATARRFARANWPSIRAS